MPAINHGFGGSRIADNTHYADQIVVPYHPKLIIMYAGDNDVAEGRTSGQVIHDFIDFVARVRRDLPDVAIAYLSIKPSVARASMWPQMRAANEGIALWARTAENVIFIDVTAKMLDAHGRPRPGLFRDDGLHMQRAGYEIWIDALKPVLAHHGFVDNSVALPTASRPIVDVQLGQPTYFNYGDDQDLGPPFGLSDVWVAADGSDESLAVSGELGFAHAANTGKLPESQRFLLRDFAQRGVMKYHIRRHSGLIRQLLAQTSQGLEQRAAIGVVNCGSRV